MFSFQDRGQFMAGLRMRGQEQALRAGFQEGFAVLAILCFAFRVSTVPMGLRPEMLAAAGIMVSLFLVPLGAGRCAQMIGAGGCGPHPLNLVAGFLVPEAVLAVLIAPVFIVLSGGSGLSMLFLRVLCLALTCALVTACTVTLGALEGKTQGRIPGVWLGRLAVTLCGGGFFLGMAGRLTNPFFPWTHVSGFYMIAHAAPRSLWHIVDGNTAFPSERLLVLQLTAQLPLLLLVLDALRGVFGGRSLVRGTKPRMLLIAVHSNVWLLLFQAMQNCCDRPLPWWVTMHFAWTALGLAAATLLFCCPSRDLLERGLCRTAGGPGWLDDAAPVGWLMAVVVLLCLAAHTAAQAGFGFLWHMDGTQTGVFLLLCVNLVATAMAWQCGRAARGRFLGLALTGAVALCWGWTLCVNRPPEWTIFISPFGILNVVENYVFAWYGRRVPPPMHGQLAAAILFNMVLVGVFSVLLAAQCQRMRKESPGG